MFETSATGNRQLEVQGRSQCISVLSHLQTKLQEGHNHCTQQLRREAGLAEGPACRVSVALCLGQALVGALQAQHGARVGEAGRYPVAT